MPTYQNNTNEPVSVSVDSRVLSWQSGESKATEYIINDSRLTLLSEAPYANDFLACETLVSTGPGDDKVIELDPEVDAVSIINYSQSGLVIFRQSLENLPGFRMQYGSSWQFTGLKHKTSRIIVQFDAAVNANEIMLYAYRTRTDW